MEYLVEWKIDIEAETPEEAARKALAIHRNRESIATVFHVFAKGQDEPTIVDLTEIDSPDDVLDIVDDELFIHRAFAIAALARLIDHVGKNFPEPNEMADFLAAKALMINLQLINEGSLIPPTDEAVASIGDSAMESAFAGTMRLLKNVRKRD